MKKLILALMCCILILTMAFTAFAEDDAAFDLSAEQEKVEELGIPTVSSVSAMKREADKLWESKDYLKAAEAYAVYAKHANWLANIISGGLEPYYSADYDSRKEFDPQILNYRDLSAAESKANSYKAERNRAKLYEGLCYYYLNDYEAALPLLINALEIIEIEDEANWELGMNALYSIVGYK